MKKRAACDRPLSVWPFLARALSDTTQAFGGAPGATLFSTTVTYTSYDITLPLVAANAALGNSKRPLARAGRSGGEKEAAA
jgi:hypothetical protein